MQTGVRVRAALVVLLGLSFIITGCSRQLSTSLFGGDETLSRDGASSSPSGSTGGTGASHPSQSLAGGSSDSSSMDSSPMDRMVMSDFPVEPPPQPNLKGSDGDAFGLYPGQEAQGQGNPFRDRIFEEGISSHDTQQGRGSSRMGSGEQAFESSAHDATAGASGGSSAASNQDQIEPLRDQDLLTAMAAASGKSGVRSDLKGTKSSDQGGDGIDALDDQIFEKGRLQDVFFDFDASTIRADAESVLHANAQILKANFEDRRVIIEGHCDERGTAEYNLVLGERRAQSTKEYLVNLGVSALSIQTISYGKERPFCTASQPDCWKMNRRGHFVVQ